MASVKPFLVIGVVNNKRYNKFSINILLNGLILKKITKDVL